MNKFDKPSYIRSLKMSTNYGIHGIRDSVSFHVRISKIIVDRMRGFNEENAALAMRREMLDSFLAELRKSEGLILNEIDKMEEI